MKNLQFPIGTFKDQPIVPLKTSIDTIAQLPEKLDFILEQYSSEHYNRPYRPNGWTGAQVVHHIADSHMNSFIRYKLALTEDNPTIKPYLEDKWALLPDVNDIDPQISVSLIHNLHRRWSHLLYSLVADDFERTYYHPELQQYVPLHEATHMYAWHGAHHLAHLQIILEQ